MISNPTQIIYRRRNLVAEGTLDNTAGEAQYAVGTINFNDEAVWPEVAVVTGTYDQMESMLAKLADTDNTDDINGAYGRIDKALGTFVNGSEYGTNLTLIDGTGSLLPQENEEAVTYNSWESYLDGTNPLAPFDVIFINCGYDYEYGSLIENTSVLRNYVLNGGRLYVTDLAYDYVEQVFPEIMQFSGDPSDPGTPGDINAAE